jgi:hypothetical protein
MIKEFLNVALTRQEILHSVSVCSARTKRGGTHFCLELFADLCVRRKSTNCDIVAGPWSGLNREKADHFMEKSRATFSKKKKKLKKSCRHFLRRKLSQM